MSKKKDIEKEYGLPAGSLECLARTFLPGIQAFFEIEENQKGRSASTGWRGDCMTWPSPSAQRRRASYSLPPFRSGQRAGGVAYSSGSGKQIDLYGSPRFHNLAATRPANATAPV